jgi:hypothetical protein
MHRSAAVVNLEAFARPAEKPARHERARFARPAEGRLLRWAPIEARTSIGPRRTPAGKSDWPDHYRMLRRIGRRLLREV